MSTRQWIVSLFGVFFVTGICSCSTTSALWTRYSDDQKAGQPSLLPNYSYAGYKYGVDGIPDVQWKRFDVTEFGAVPDDGKCDREGVKDAIRAAEVNGSGVVFFPAGTFLLAEAAGMCESLEIHGANIVLRGSGSGPGGTRIVMNNHMLEEVPGQDWTVPPLFQFVPDHPLGPTHSADRLIEAAPKLGTVVDAAVRESFSMVVDTPENFEVGQTVAVCIRNPEVNRYYLKGLQPRSIHSDILEKGVAVAEKHTVVGIEGNRIDFEEPLHTDIYPEHGWTVHSYQTVEGWGVEDLHFIGNGPAPFVHHKNAIHDSGYSILRMKHGKNSWIRRNRFTNVSAALSAEGCMASSFIMNTVDGRQGHLCFSANWGYGTLVGLSQDLTDKGMFHGPGLSHEHVGGVVWRYKSVGKSKTEPRCGGPDFHARYPYCSLWDACTANLMNNGGNHRMQPNHLRDLTYWNFEQVGEARQDYDPWPLPLIAAEKKHLYFGGAYLVFPNYIGFHGVPTTLNRDHLGWVESYGAPVEPESLYEAQLALRLGAAPAWIDAAKQEWAALSAVHEEEMQ